MASPTLKISYIDRPDVTETFADTLERVSFDGQSWRLEFCVTRMDDKKEEVFPGRKYPVSRLALTVNAGLELASKMQQIIALMEKRGTLKPNPQAANKSMDKPAAATGAAKSTEKSSSTTSGKGK